MRLMVALIFLMVLAACNETDKPDSSPTLKPKMNRETQNPLLKHGTAITSDLNVPWDVIKHGDSFFITQRSGEILKVEDSGRKSVMPLQLEIPISQVGEGGLLGFVLHPKFKTNGLAYIYHTYKSDEQVLNRIVQIKLNAGSWIEQEVLINGIPGGYIHNGGRLEIGPDGKLYATTGDAGNSSNAQDLESLSGKILRMNLDGTIPENNPFTDSYIYSYGHRNPQGLTWSGDGTLYSAEHGSSAHDEINVIRPGGNYGWPIIQGSETKAGMIPPLFHSGNTTWAPSGLAYHNGKLYVACLAGEQLRVFNLEKHTSQAAFKNIGRIRDVLITNGTMYLLTNNTDGRGTPSPYDDHLVKVNFPLD